MGGIKSGLKRVAGGSNLLHPKLNLWWVLGAVVSAGLIYFAVEYGKKGYLKTKSMVGAATPGPSGKSDIRARLGI